MDGFLVVDKQPNCTSFDIVAKVRNITKSKVGHLGTLDPKASGVLILALGKATRLIEYFMNDDKSYIFDIKWGISTDSHDAEGNATYKSENRIALNEIQKSLPQFKGKIMQIPPIYSALKINGKRAYNLARKNIDFTLNAREMHVYNLEILSHNSEYTRFNVRASKGFYVRALARDIIDHLGLAGHISYLRRTKLGLFDNKNMINSDDLFSNINQSDISSNKYDINDVFYLKNNLFISDNYQILVRNGVNININNLPFNEDDIISVRLGKQLAAICKYKSGKIIIKKMLI
jgi:tRNA pseudouridine55 synthase